MIGRFRCPMSAAEVRAELRGLISGRVGVADGVVPPLLFVSVNALWGVNAAAVAGLGSAAAVSIWRLARGKAVRFAVAGLLGTLEAVGLALRAGSAVDYFLPGILTGALTTVLILASILLRRPFVAWTSWLTRGWPLGWYWHARVRPAYSRASWLWAGFFGTRTVVQWLLFSNGETLALAVARVLMGWPALIVLLVFTYVLGRRWLAALDGPSVEEFEAGAPQPWTGQQKGF